MINLPNISSHSLPPHPALSFIATILSCFVFLTCLRSVSLHKWSSSVSFAPLSVQPLKERLEQNTYLRKSCGWGGVVSGGQMNNEWLGKAQTLESDNRVELLHLTKLNDLRPRDHYPPPPGYSLIC